MTVDFPGRRQLNEQLHLAMVRCIDENGSLAFAPGTQPAAEVTNRVPVEGEGLDADGTPVYMLLHVVAGRVHELEVYRADGAPVRDWPEPDSLELFAPYASGSSSSQ